MALSTRGHASKAARQDLSTLSMNAYLNASTKQKSPSTHTAWHFRNVRRSRHTLSWGAGTQVQFRPPQRLSTYVIPKGRTRGLGETWSAWTLPVNCSTRATFRRGGTLSCFSSFLPPSSCQAVGGWFVICISREVRFHVFFLWCSRYLGGRKMARCGQQSCEV
jgi:hypothetical protein